MVTHHTIVFSSIAIASFCPPLPTIRNGAVKSVGRSVGTAANVTCDPGYQKVTRTPLVCKPDFFSDPVTGRWDGDVKCVGELF